MTNSRKTATAGKKQKRGFAVLDREKALLLAVGAVGFLRKLSTFATSAAAWRCGLGNALGMLETELNDILLFSSASRLPEDLFSDADAETVPEDLGKARKAARKQVDVLRKILNDARADLSVTEIQCNQLDNALGLVEQELNNLLPPPGAPPRATLPAEWFGDDCEAVTVESESESGAEMKR